MPDKGGGGEGVAYRLHYGVLVVVAGAEVDGCFGRVLHAEGDLRMVPR
jgi:hypothetical protein